MLKPRRAEHQTRCFLVTLERRLLVACGVVLLGFYSQQFDSSLRRLRRLGGKLTHECQLCREHAGRLAPQARCKPREMTEFAREHRVRRRSKKLELRMASSQS